MNGCMHFWKLATKLEIKLRFLHIEIEDWGVCVSLYVWSVYIWMHTYSWIFFSQSLKWRKITHQLNWRDGLVIDRQVRQLQSSGPLNVTEKYTKGNNPSHRLYGWVCPCVPLHLYRCLLLGIPMQLHICTYLTEMCVWNTANNILCLLISGAKFLAVN